METYQSALELAAAIRRRDLSPLEAMEHHLAAVDALDPLLNAFTLRDDERALAEARRATDVVAHTPGEDLPPFIGVPIPIKDLDDVAGWPTSHGSWSTDPAPVATDSLVVGRLRDGGFVLMGKTNTPEFGTVSFTENERFGITRNPWNTDHTPGGSSGGAAAAVASGMAPIAQGSDGGGSIRIPASCCGLVGLKPARHRVTTEVELYHGGATNGMLTRTVADTAAALDVISRFDPGAWCNAPAPERPFLAEVGRDPGALRIVATTTSPVGIPSDPACVAAVEAVLATLAGLGHRVSDEEPTWPDVEQFAAAFFTIWNTGSVYAPIVDPTRLEPHDRSMLDGGTATSAVDYAAAVLTLQRGTRTVATQFGSDFDLLVTPTMCVEPPKVGSWLVGTEDDPGNALLNCMPMAAFTAPFNMTGLPAMSVPTHVAPSGLPVGVQLVAGPWREDLLIRVAAQLEAAVGWADRRPSLPA